MDIFNNRYGHVFEKYNIPKVNVQIGYYDNVFEHRNENIVNTIVIKRNPKNFEEIMITWDRSDLTLALWVIEIDMDHDMSNIKFKYNNVIYDQFSEKLIIDIFESNINQGYFIGNETDTTDLLVWFRFIKTDIHSLDKALLSTK